MYEAFFGLRKRPYAAAPDASILVGTPAVTDAAARLDRCIRQGRGVGVLTAAAGMGKTHLCHWLAREWGRDFKAVVLPNAGFPTRRGLLQSVLAELDEPYQRLAEAELRLQLTSVARTLKGQGTGVVLLFDEAHRHSERILEEIRLVSNLVAGGEPLIRVVLAGQMELEERLAEPALAGLNERVGELVTLPRFTAEESAQYLRDRAAFAGGDLSALFAPEAVRIIVQACGGAPRCLNQLADHGLLLGYVSERRPVDEGLVREALDDLKRLPLHWHDPLPTDQPVRVVSERDVEISSPEFEETIEVGGLSEHEIDVRAVGAPSPGETEPEMATPEVGNSGGGVRRTAASAGEFLRERLPRPETEAIRDRFARLDAAEARRLWTELVQQQEAARECDAMPQAQTAVGGRPDARSQANPLEILDRIEPLIAEALNESRFAPLVVTAEPLEAAAGNGSTTVSESSAVAVAAPASRAARIGTRQSTLFRDLRRQSGDRAKGDR